MYVVFLHTHIICLIFLKNTLNTVPDGNCVFFFNCQNPKFPKFHHIPLPPTSLSSSLHPHSREAIVCLALQILYPLYSNKPDVCCGRSSCIDSSIQRYVFIPHGLEEGRKRRFVSRFLTFAHFFLVLLLYTVILSSGCLSLISCSALYFQKRKKVPFLVW